MITKILKFPLYVAGATFVGAVWGVWPLGTIVGVWWWWEEA